MVKSTQIKHLHIFNLFRILNFLAVIVYPILGWMRLSSYPEENVDIEGRLIVCTALAIIFYSSFFSRLKEHYHDLLQIGSWIFISHLYYVAYLNNMSPYYTYSTFYLIFAVTLVIQTRASLFAFFTYTISIAIFSTLVSQTDESSHHFLSLGLVLMISYIGYVYREKFIHEAYVSQKVQELINRLLELLLIDNTFERTIKQSVSTIQKAPWFEVNSAIAIYLVSNGKMKFMTDNGLFNRIPFSGINTLKYDITTIQGPQGILGAIVSSKEDSYTNISEKERLTHLRSIADSLGILIRRQQKEKIIKKQQMQLTQSAKMVALGEMAGGIAHEINTPLTVISNHVFNLKLMQEISNIDEVSLEKSLDKIEQTVFRIASIVRGLQNMSRDGSMDKMELTPLSSIIDEAFSMCEERFKSRGVEFAKPSDPKVHIMCRKVQISQVLVNLLNNAYDAIEGLPDKKITIKVKSTDDSVAISVIDSGTGVPSEIQGKLFQPFFTTKGVGKGTGLGLSISHGIITHHGGDLFYTDANGKSEFVISLPLPQRLNAAS